MNQCDQITAMLELEKLNTQQHLMNNQILYRQVCELQNNGAPLTVQGLQNTMLQNDNVHLYKKVNFLWEELRKRRRPAPIDSIANKLMQMDVMHEQAKNNLLLAECTQRDAEIARLRARAVDEAVVEKLERGVDGLQMSVETLQHELDKQAQVHSRTVAALEDALQMLQDELDKQAEAHFRTVAALERKLVMVEDDREAANLVAQQLLDKVNARNAGVCETGVQTISVEACEIGVQASCVQPCETGVQTDAVTTCVVEAVTVEMRDAGEQTCNVYVRDADEHKAEAKAAAKTVTKLTTQITRLQTQKCEVEHECKALIENVHRLELELKALQISNKALSQKVIEKESELQDFVGKLHKVMDMLEQEHKTASGLAEEKFNALNELRAKTVQCDLLKNMANNLQDKVKALTKEVQEQKRDFAEYTSKLHDKVKALTEEVQEKKQLFVDYTVNMCDRVLDSME